MRRRPGAIVGEVRAATRVGDRVLAVGGAGGRERAWWIDPATLDVTGVDVAPPGAGDGAGGPVGASGLAVFTDGRWVVITGRRLPLPPRDPRTLAPVRTLSPEPNWVRPAIVDDRYLLATRHGELARFGLDTGRELDQRAPVDVAFVSPDGLTRVAAHRLGAAARRPPHAPPRRPAGRPAARGRVVARRPPRYCDWRRSGRAD